MDKIQCEKKIYGSGTWSSSSHKCDRPAKVEHDGKHYCLIHDPVRVKMQEQKRSDEYDKRNRNAKRTRRINLIDNIWELIDELGVAAITKGVLLAEKNRVEKEIEK